MSLTGKYPQKIGIICASDDELAPFLPHMEQVHITKKAMLSFHEGQLCGIPTVALYSGVCKVNAAIAAQILIDVYRVDIILNAGTAGGMDPNIQLFDTVIGTQCAYHDVADDILTEFHPWLPSLYFPADAGLLEIAASIARENKTVRLGRMVTGECFIADTRREAINEKFAPLSVDMETAGIAHVCYVNQVPFLSIRSITDTALHSGSAHFEANCARASGIAKDVVLSVLEELSRRNTAPSPA